MEAGEKHVSRGECGDPDQCQRGLRRPRTESQPPALFKSRGVEALSTGRVYAQPVHFGRAPSSVHKPDRSRKTRPQFVDAYYMLFEVYFADGQLPPHNDTMANFRWVVDSLRALAPDSAQYHTANAWIKYKEWRFEEEIAELKLALRANPKFLRAHGFYGGIMLRARGDAETALREFRAAEQIDPRDSIIQMHLGTP